MFHHDVQIYIGKRNNHEHPMDRVLTGYLNPVRNSHINTRIHKYRSETNNIIQRQRVIRSFLNKPDENEPSIRKPTTLGTTPKSLSVTSISSPPMLFAEINDSSTNNNNNRQQIMKKEFEYQSPISIRRQRPTIENLSSIHQMSDITDISGNQLSIAIPPNFIFRHKPSRVLISDRPSFKVDESISSPRIKPLNYSKTMNENNTKQTIFIPKIITQSASHSTHTWTPILTDQTSTPTRALVNTLHAKAHVLKRFKNHQRQSQTDKTPKTNYIQDLFISPRPIINPHHQEYDTNKKIPKTRSTLYELADDLKYNHDVISDDDESINLDACSSISTCTSQSDHSFSPLSKPKVRRLSLKRHFSRRGVYNHLLSPLTEYDDDYETGDEV